MIEHDRHEPKTYTAEQVSQGYIVLRTPLRKAVFFGGLALAVLLAVVFGIPHRP